MSSRKAPLVGRVLAAVAVALASCRSQVDSGNPGSEVKAPAAPELDALLHAVDRSVDPCTDFYAYACGRASESAADDERHVVDRLFFGFDRASWEWLTQPPGHEGPTADIRRFVSACRAAGEATEVGDALESLLAEIERVNDAAAFLRVSGVLQRSGIDTILAHWELPDDHASANFHAVLGGRGSSASLEVLRADSTSQDRRELADRIAARLEVLGQPVPAARVEGVMTFEARLLQAHGDADDGTDHAVPSIFAERVAGGSWAGFVRALELPADSSLVFIGLAYAEAVPGIVEDTPPEVLRAYLEWQLLESLASDLPSGWSLPADRPEDRANHCAALALELWDHHLLRALGSAWLGEDARALAVELAEDVRAAVSNGLNDTPWLSASSRRDLAEVIGSTRVRVAWADAPWGTLPSMHDGAHVSNVLALRAYRTARSMAIDFGFDQGRSGGRPYRVDQAWNDQTLHGVDVALGILQPPVFDARRPRWLNISSLGMILGHELHHGLAPDGLPRQLEALGRDPTVSATLEDAYACLSAAYLAERPAIAEVLQSAHRHHPAWIEETVADIGGLRHAYRLFAAERDAGRVPTPEGWSPDALYFIGSAQYFCSWDEGEMQRRSRARVNAAVAAVPEFREAFECGPDSIEVLAHECRVW